MKKKRRKINIFEKIYYKIRRFFRCIFIPSERKVYNVKCEFGNFSRLPSDDFYIKKIPYELLWDSSKTIPAFLIGILSAHYEHALGYADKFQNIENYKEYLFMIINKLELYLRVGDNDDFDWSAELKDEQMKQFFSATQWDIEGFLNSEKNASVDLLMRNDIEKYELREEALKEALQLLGENLSTIWL